MDEQKASPMSEALLWRLYRRLLAIDLLAKRMQSGRGEPAQSSAISAALTENLGEGDTLGLAAGDQSTRYLCGVPLERLRQTAARTRSGAPAWLQPEDADHGLLPGTAAQQASLALGTSLAARLHHTGSITVLFKHARAAARKPTQVPPEWESAAETAAALKLPLLCITGARGKPEAIPGAPPATLPVIPVDRADTLALYRVIYESAARARSGGGPTWIECHSWIGSRQAAAAGAARQANLDPLGKMEQALRARKLFEERLHRQLTQAIEKEFASGGWPQNRAR